MSFWMDDILLMQFLSFSFVSFTCNVRKYLISKPILVINLNNWLISSHINIHVASSKS